MVNLVVKGVEKMDLAILGPRRKGYEEERLIREGKRIFRAVDYFPIPHVVIKISKGKPLIFCRNKNLLNYDAILPRIPRSYKTYGFILLSLFKAAGKFLPIDPFSVILSHNKFLTLLCLAEHNLPVPRSFLSLRRSILEHSIPKIGYPVVLKLLYGSLGVGVMFADSKESAISIMDTLERFNQPIFLEEYIENPGEDVRAYVVGDEIVASMKRIAKNGERRANIGMGGRGEPYKLKSKEAEMVLDAARALKMKICGLDFIKSFGKPVITESNVSAQFQGLETATKVNVAKSIVKFLKAEAKK